MVKSSQIKIKKVKVWYTGRDKRDWNYSYVITCPEHGAVMNFDTNKVATHFKKRHF